MEPPKAAVTKCIHRSVKMWCWWELHGGITLLRRLPLTQHAPNEEHKNQIANGQQMKEDDSCNRTSEAAAPLALAIALHLGHGAAKLNGSEAVPALRVVSDSKKMSSIVTYRELVVVDPEKK